MNKKKLISLIFAAVLVVFAMASCTRGTNDDDSATNQENVPPVATPAPTPPVDTGNDTADDEPVTIVIGLSASVMVEDHATNWKTLYLEEYTGFNLEFDVFPMDAADARTQFTLRVAGGQQLPCVTILPFNEAQVWELANAGVFTQITDWWNDPQVSPNVWNMDPDDRVFVTNALTLPDGHIYSIPTFAPSAWGESVFRTWINQEWLANLDLEIPRTTDEFRDVLYAFVNNDPNGNGSRTIGMTGAFGGWGTDPVVFLMNAFTYVNPDRWWLHVEDGIVYSVHSRPEFRDGMEFISGLVRDGLLDLDGFTQSAAELTALSMSEEAVVGVLSAGSSVAMFGLDGPIFDRMHLMYPLVGPSGVSYAPQTVSLPAHSWQVTRDALNPLAAYQLGELFMSDYWARVSSSGEYGVSWTRDPDVFAQWRGRFQMVPDSVVVFPETDPWGRPGNTIWGVGPRYFRWSETRGAGHMPMDDYLESGVTIWNQMHYEAYGSRFPQENIGRRLLTDEELTEVAGIQALLIEHINANNAAFATGQRPMSEFDSFLQELDAFGMQRFIQLTQNGHNRANGLPPVY